MKNIFALIILCLLFKINFAQQQTCKIEYIFVIDGDTCNTANLYFDKSKSFFQMQNEKLKDSISKTNLNNTFTFNKIKNVALFEGNVIENNLNVLLTRTKSFDGITYLIEETTPKIDWKLVNEQKKINSLNCSKATGSFRGRNYTAWYTSDIPVAFGPYKFCGLPGLIIEIKDDDNFVLINAKKIEIPTDATIDFEKIMTNYKQKITLREFVDKLKMANSYGRQYMERILAKIPKQKGVKIKISNSTVSTDIGESIEKQYEWEKEQN
jgi:GLPGLI family protein